MILDLIARLRSDAALDRTLRRVAPCAAILCSCAVALADETVASASREDAAPRSFTCRLSVLDGGQPRGANSSVAGVAEPAGERPNPFAGPAPNFDKSHWKFRSGETARTAAADGALPTAGKPIAGDFNGDGTAEIGWFVDGQWFIDLNGNGVWDRDDLWAQLGSASDQPLVGDWDGDGKADIGVFGPDAAAADRNDSTGAGLPDAENDGASKAPAIVAADETARPVRQLQCGADGERRTDAVDFVFDFGPQDGLAVAGDFNGDGIDTIAVFRGGQWFVDVDGDGRLSPADFEAQFGQEGDRPIVGDFNGDGIDTIGVYRDGKWLIPGDRNEQDDTVILLGGPDDTPSVGDWDGDGRDDPGVYSAH